MPIQVADPLNAFLSGRRAGIEMQQQQRNNALLDMQLENAPREQGVRNALLDAQLRNANQSFDINQQQGQREQQQFETNNQALQAKQTYAKSRYVLKSQSPKKTVESQFPEFIAEVQKGGTDWNDPAPVSRRPG